jgi:exodeoxyribonuclease VII large subunit
MAFNEEVVVRAAAASIIPLISGVGHETDTTLIDWAADLRAPTPTAAAERAVPVRAELIQRIQDLGGRAAAASQRRIGEERLHLIGLGRGLGDPMALIATALQRLDDRTERFGNALQTFVRERRSRIEHAKIRDPRELVQQFRKHLEQVTRRIAVSAERIVPDHRNQLRRIEGRLRPEPIKQVVNVGRERVMELGQRARQAVERESKAWARQLSSVAALLESFSYERVLERGFALVRDAAGAPVVSSKGLKPMDPLSLKFADGETPVTVGGKPSKGPRRPGDGSQGSLL